MQRILVSISLLMLLALPALAGSSDDAKEAGTVKVPDVSAAAPLAPQVQNGIHFLSGGVGVPERAALVKQEDQYNVRVVLTRRDGAYLSNVDVVIESDAGSPLVETTTRGPILLARLAPGRYVLRASDEGRTSERRVIDVPKQPEQVRLYVGLAEKSDAAKSSSPTQ